MFDLRVVIFLVNNGDFEIEVVIFRVFLALFAGNADFT